MPDAGVSQAPTLFIGGAGGDRRRPHAVSTKRARQRGVTRLFRRYFERYSNKEVRSPEIQLVSLDDQSSVLPTRKFFFFIPHLLPSFLTEVFYSGNIIYK